MKIKTSLSNKLMVMLILLSVFTGTLAYRGIVDVDIMEARNYVAAREMADGGSLLIPTMNGDLRIAKPPLPTWLTAAAVEYAGTDNAMSVLRVPSAIAGIVILIGLYMIARFFGGSERIGYSTVLVMSTSFLFMLLSRKNTWDVYAHAFMILGLAAVFYVQIVRAGNILLYYVIGGLMFAGSFMSKGPVSFYTVLLPVIIAACITFSPLSFLRRNYGKLMICTAVTLLLSSLWPLYVFYHEPHSVLYTAVAESSAWVNRHTKPFWYYIQFPMMSGLWCILLVPLLYPKFAFKRINPVRVKFYLIWLAAALILLSVIPEKKDRYLFPVVIPSAMLIGEYLAALTGGLTLRRADRIIMSLWVFVCVTALTGAITAAIYLQIAHKAGHWGYFITAETVSLLALGFCLYRIRTYGAVKAVPGAVLCTCCAFLVITPFIKIPEQDFRVLEQARNEQLLDKYNVFYGDIGIKEIWAVGRIVRPLEKLPAGSGEAAFITSDEDQLPLGFNYKKILRYRSKEGRSWTFYKLERLN